MNMTWMYVFNVEKRKGYGSNDEGDVDDDTVASDYQTLTHADSAILVLYHFPSQC
jgi:hypothetical protein